ncbi:MAG: type II toxin-antitoxin system VapC family toxin, partial [Nitrososphaerota archaeon]|nr:type II toxin-antitoxin system VapC family toxin [Nitrososphaerota archaeon]
SNRYFLDTSIPIYAAGRPSEHKVACTRVLEKIENKELKAAIDAEVVQEILFRYGRLEMPKEGLELSQNVLRLGLLVLPVTRRDIEDMLPLYERYHSKGVPPRDALHAAVMKNHGLSKVISVDKHFGDIVEEVERVDPTTLL